MILNETMNEIADAIREKTGKSELIKPVDFATEIKGITAGGSGESGGSNMVYFDVSGIDLLDYPFLLGAAIMGKFFMQNITVIAPIYFLLMESSSYYKNATALGVDLDKEMLFPPFGVTTLTKIKDIPQIMDSFASVPRLTKEQFYDLNA